MPQTLTIGTTPYSQWQHLQPLLNHLGWNQQPQDPETWYQTDPTPAATPHLLLHTRPELAIAHALDAGDTPERALQHWQQAAEHLLTWYKGNRRQASMVEITSAAAQPDALIGWLRQNHPAFYNIPGAIELPAGEPAAPGNLNLLIATQLVAQTPALNSLLAQLEASSIPVADHHYPKPDVDILAIHEEVNEQSEQAQQHAETVSSECQALEAQLKQLKSVQSNLEAQLQKAETDQKNLQDENTLLLEQLHKVQEELETYYHKAKNGDSESASLKAQNTELEQRLQQAKTQDIERLKSVEVQETGTSQATRVQLEKELATQKQALEKSETLQASFKEENDLVLKQLFKVQEELESYYLQNQDLKKSKKAAERQKQAAEAELKKQKNEYNLTVQLLHSAQKELDKQRHSLKAEQAKINALTRRLSRSEQRLNRTQKALTQVREHFKPSFMSKAIRALGKIKRHNRLVSHQIALVQASEYFDPRWYQREYPDVALHFDNPAEHYVRHGAHEGRQPGPRFNASEYLKQNPDVAGSGQNPLVHYLMHGRTEGRRHPGKA